MTEDTQAADEGLVAAIKKTSALLLAMARTRLELLSTDLEEGRTRLISLLIMTFVSLFCLCFGVVLLAIFVVIAFWESHRLLVLGGLTATFLTVGIVLCILAIRAAKMMPSLFEASLVELAKDQEVLEIDHE